jgi:prepilin-type N-terminal cleavage/methylation domain-containing protein/prepilin-type processing-associated H-X9-DG protein
MNSTTPRRAFTLVELLAVIAIIGLLIALLLPAVQSARESARRTQCGNNIRQIAIGMLTHHELMGGFPFGCNYPLKQMGLALRDRQSWFHELLPFVEQQPLRDQLMAHLASGGSVWLAPNRWIPIPTFMCPSDPVNPKVITGGWSERPGGTPEDSQGFHGNYLACSGTAVNNPSTDIDGVNLSGLFMGSPSPADIRRRSLAHCRDGASNTLLVGETVLVADNLATNAHDLRGRYWNAHVGSSLFSTRDPPNSSVGDRGWCIDVPPVARCQAVASNNVAYSLRSRHPGGANGAMADGSVRFFDDSIDPVAYRGLGSRAGRETSPAP